MRKRNPNAKLFHLPEEQQAQLAEWMLSGRPYHQCQAEVEKEFGVKVALSAFTPFWDQVCVPQLLLRKKSAEKAADAIVASSSKNAANVEQALLLQLKSKALQVCNDPNASAEDIMMVTSMALKIRDQDLAAQKQHLAREKFEFDAAKAALKQLPALRKISSDNKLSEDDKLTKARQLLFGELPE